MDFNKYCNCYSSLNGKISVECYDTLFEAINKDDYESEDIRVESRLVIMNKFLPKFIQKIMINNAFSKPVIFIPRCKLLLEPKTNSEMEKQTN